MKSICYLASFLFFWNTAYTQTFTGRSATNLISGADKVILDQENNHLKYASFEGSPPNLSAKNTSEWLRSVLKLTDEYGFEKRNTLDDKVGMTHTKYQQTFQQVPIENAIMTVHTKGNEIGSISGVYFDIAEWNTVDPAYSKSAAIQKAKAITNAKVYQWNDADFPEPELVIFPEGKHYFLAYKVDVFAVEPLSRKYLFLDATTGDLLHSYERIHYTEAMGTAQTRYSGERMIVTDSLSSGEFRLHDLSRGGGLITKDMNGSESYGSADEIVDSDNLWTSGPHNADAALDAHWGTEMTYDFYFETFGRNSYDNAGSPITSYVDYGISFSNAFWNGEAMTYGAGGGEYSPFPSLEIVGHEITHGVTEHSAGLIYEDESGALNESFSDIFGVTVDFFARPEMANYLNGEEISPNPGRSLENPKLYGSPDTYYGENWYNGSYDHGGVHTNSGVQNHWFYLLAEGGSGTNDIGNSYSIASIGREAAAAIAYRNLTVYLSPSSDYFDARTFSILSATDLYGACSPEVITVTNAWYAVGVGQVFNNAVVAAFEPSQTYACQVPATIDFENYSLNGLNYIWNFGDDSTSTEANPSHTYTEPGLYTVTLQTAGAAECGNEDELVRIDLIHVENIGGPLSPLCEPEPSDPAAYYGISYFELNTIQNTSGSSLEGYQDYSCTASTELEEGNIYTLSAVTFSQEYLAAWIDFDNDGDFSASEMIYNSPTPQTTHTAEVWIPQGIVYDTPLRLRLRSSELLADNSCEIFYDGQVEDYQVSIVENLDPPIGQFEASTQLGLVGSQISFADLSINLPESWEWTFEGGTPASSTDQNPIIQYNELGTFDVALIVSNEYGSDTLTIVDFISIVNAANMCETDLITSESGQLYDSGGPDGNYQNGENCTLLIAPPCALSVTLSFQSFLTEGYYDYLRIYDGFDYTAPLLLSLDGSESPIEIVSSSGALFLEFHSDGSYTTSGWEASWTSQTPTTNPEAGFDISDYNPALNEAVEFTDLTTEFPSEWHWDFGDGNSASVQNPTHSYSLPGTYNVTLIVGNCYSSDTLLQTLVVQEAPVFSIAPPDTVYASVSCGGITETSFTIYNEGGGDLLVSAGSLGGALGSESNVLALVTYTDYSQEYLKTIQSINSYFTDYTLAESSAINSDQLNADLEGIDILLIPEQEDASSLFFSNISDALINFVNNGGNILVCGGQYIPTGVLFSPSTMTLANDLTVVNSDVTSPLMTGLPESFDASNATIAFDWSADPDMNTVANTSFLPNITVVGEKSIGEGNVVYVGYDYYEITTTNSQIIGNAMNYLASYVAPQWIETSFLDSIYTISSGDSLVVQLNLSAAELLAGDFFFDTQIATNDPENPLVDYVFHINVVGAAELTASPDSIYFDSVIAGNALQDTLIVVNSGCDSLYVNAELTSSVFGVSPATLAIRGYEQDTLFLSFQGESPGVYSDQILLTSNGGDENISLFAEALNPPEIALAPADTLHATAYCGTSDSASFTVFNNGLGPLELDAIFDISPGVSVLALTTYTDLYEEYPRTIDAINESYTDYILTTTNANSSPDLSEALEGMDILLIPEMEGVSPSFWTNLSPALLDFVYGGGRILVCANSFIYATGLFPEVPYDNINSGQLNNIHPNHPIMSGVSDVFQAPNLTFMYDWVSNTDIETLAVNSASSGYSVVAVRNFGLGKVVYVGFDYYQTNSAASAIIGNAMQYLASGMLADWIEAVSPELPATIPPGDSLEFQVTFNAAGLLAGDYYSNFTYLTNDPQNDTINYVFHLEVEGNALLAVSEDTLSFEPILTGAESVDTLLIYNNGCADLELNVAFENPDFSISPTSITIPAFSQDSLFAHFHPTEVGVFNTNFQLLSNGGDTLITFSGEGLAAPLMVLEPQELTVNAEACADSVLVTFTIHNDGEGVLEYNLFNTPSKANLETVLNDLSSSYSELTQWVPNLYLFSGGETGNGISDGGSDMYDGGNYLNTNLWPVSNIPYTNNSIQSSNAFGDEGRYFTGKFPGLFVMVADINDLQSFTISGNLGADGAGNINDLLLTHTAVDGRVYKALITRVYGAGDPSINHMVILEDSPIVGHTFLSSTNYEGHTISDLTDSDRIYYLLFSSNPGIMMQDAALQQMFESFLDIVAGESTVSADTAGEIEAGGSSEISLYLQTTGLEVGIFDIPIVVNSNDPLHPMDSVMVHLNIPGNVCSDFEFSSENSCGGQFDFTDLSIHNPTSWNWDFGDGSTSVYTNPSHNYMEVGEYTVSLEVCNDVDCNTISKTVLVENVSNTAPASCTPYTGTDYSNYRITQFKFDEQYFPSDGSISGYQDFTCETPLEAVIGSTYEMTVSTSTNDYFYVRAWIDYNNDGEFSTNENVLSANYTQGGITAAVTIPTGTPIGIPLRLRIMADETSTSPCGSYTNGEAEDYSIILSPINAAPQADFTWEVIDECSRIYHFIDQSTHIPNGWAWDFGDGATANIQNPYHIYESSGNFEIELTSSNSIGSDSQTQSLNILPQGFSVISVGNVPVLNEQTYFSAPAEGVGIWSWDFGDGFTMMSSGPDVSHTYSAIGTYTVTVSASTNLCMSEVSIVITVVMADSDGLTESDTSIWVYPNPSNGYLTISYPEDMELKEILLFDAIGRKVFIQAERIGQGEFKLEVMKPVAGVYMLTLRLNSGKVIRTRVVLE